MHLIVVGQDIRTIIIIGKIQLSHLAANLLKKWSLEASIFFLGTQSSAKLRTLKTAPSPDKGHFNTNLTIQIALFSEGGTCKCYLNFIIDFFRYSSPWWPSNLYLRVTFQLVLRFISPSWVEKQCKLSLEIVNDQTMRNRD